MTGIKSNLRRLAGPLLLAGLGATLGACSEEPDVTIGLITKQEVNPYWVTMREVAEDTAEDNDVTLLTATGTSDVDVESQQRALQEMVAEGAKGILIAPTSSTGLLPAIEAARGQGVLVIAVDTPVDPLDAVDAYFATDNQAAGRLVGQYALVKAQEMGIEPKIAMLDLAPGISSGELRHAGFLDGFGIAEGDPAIVAMADTEGDRELGEAKMAEILAEHADVNVIYTVNEPAALGALDALRDANVDLSRTILVSIDGGCRAIKDAVRPGDIDATVMQFPENMAREGVRALATAIRAGENLSGNLDTGARTHHGGPCTGCEIKRRRLRRAQLLGQLTQLGPRDKLGDQGIRRRNRFVEASGGPLRGAMHIVMTGLLFRALRTMLQRSISSGESRARSGPAQPGAKPYDQLPRSLYDPRCPAVRAGRERARLAPLPIRRSAARDRGPE